MSTQINRTKRSWILVLIFGSIIVLSVIAIILILAIKEPVKDSISFEIVKSLLQIVTVLVLGQVVSLVVAQYNFNRQQEEARTEFQREILDRLANIYIGILKQRRLLRAKGLSKPYIGKIQEGTEVLFDSFDRQMQFVNEASGKIKAIVQEINSSPTAFKDSKSLIKHMEKMEDYLRKLITLYEQKLGIFSGKGSKLFLEDLAISHDGSTFGLRDFVDKARDSQDRQSQFDAEFIDSYHEASKMIREDILM